MFSNCEITSNGISFSSAQTSKFKTSILVFSITVPLTPERLINNALLAGIFRRGTHSLPSISSLNKSLDELYGSCVEVRSTNKGKNLSLMIIVDVIDNKYVPDDTDVLGGAIDIVSELILAPHFCDPDFPKSIFEQEKKILVDNLLAIKNNTRAYSIKRCSDIMHEGSPEHLTYEQSIALAKDASFDNVLKYYKEVILNSPMEIFYMGASDPLPIKEKLSCVFADKKCSLTSSKNQLAATKRTSFCSISEKMPVSQGKLALGFSTGVTLADDYHTALMFNEIFGGSASSKLFLNVREKMGLCYFCSSSYGIHNGILRVSCGIEVNKRELAKKAILEQLEDIKNGKISEFELEAARKSIANGYRQLYDSPFDVYNFYSARSFFGIFESIEDCCEKLLAVTPHQICEFARSISLDAEFFIEGTSLEADEEDFEND